MDTLVDIVKAVIWPLCISTSLLIIILAIIFIARNEIKGVIKRVKRVKQGSTEVEVAEEPKKVEESEKANTAPQEPTEDDNIPQDLSPQESITSPDTESKTTNELRRQMIGTLLGGDLQQGKELYDQLQETETDRTQQLKDKGVYLYLRYRHGETSALIELKKLAEESTVAASTHSWIGFCYEFAGDFGKAVEEYQQAVQDSRPEERTELIVALARSQFKAGDQQVAFSSIMKELGTTGPSEAVAELHRGLADLYRLAGNHEFRALALDKALENKPNDTDLLFDAAYSYSMDDYDLLALLHYETLLRFQPETVAALNNIGVTYQELRMPIHSVEFQEKAFETDPDYTLAAANLGYKYMDAGFAGDALSILNKARQREEVHPNVGSALSALSQKRESEDEVRDKLLRLAREEQRFLREFADAYFVSRGNPPSFNGTWDSDRVSLDITQENNLIKGVWIDKKTTDELELEGEVKNRAAVINRKSKWKATTSRAYLSPDGERLFIMTLEDEVPKYETCHSTDF